LGCCGVWLEGWLVVEVEYGVVVFVLGGECFVVCCVVGFG